MKICKSILVGIFIFIASFVFSSEDKNSYTSFEQMKAFDVNKDNKISVDEFVNYLLQEERREGYLVKKDKLLRIFKKYDKNFSENGENFITAKDFESTHKQPIIEGVRLMIIGMSVVFVFLIILIIVMNLILVLVKIINKISPEVDEPKANTIKKAIDEYEDIAVVIAVVKSFTKD